MSTEYVDPTWRRYDATFFKAWEHVLKFDTSRPPKPGEIVPCLLCATLIEVKMYVGHPDQLCRSCRKTYDECATLVCNTCPGRPVIGRIAPTITVEGFYIKKNMVLHVPYCPTCRPKAEYSEVIEINQWMARQAGTHGMRLISLGDK